MMQSSKQGKKEDCVGDDASTPKCQPPKLSTTQHACDDKVLESAGSDSGLSGISLENVKKQICETQERLMNDPRTKQLIESGQHTYEEIKKFVYEQLPNRYTIEKPSTNEATTYAFSPSWYPVMYHSTSIVAAPNSLFEVTVSEDTRSKITFYPRLDAYFNKETKEIVLHVDLPGMSRPDVNIEVEEGFLTLSGTRVNFQEESCQGIGSDGSCPPTEKFEKLLGDRMFGFFSRKFRLPENIRSEEITATLINGVLDVIIQCTDVGFSKRIVDVS